MINVQAYLIQIKTKEILKTPPLNLYGVVCVGTSTTPPKVEIRVEKFRFFVEIYVLKTPINS